MAKGTDSLHEIDPYRPKTPYRCCDAYIMEKSMLEYLIEDAASHAYTDFVWDALVRNVSKFKLNGYRYDGYVARLDSVPSYFKHNMDLFNEAVRADLFNAEHPIYTKVKDEAPTRYGAEAKVKNSLLADGCIVEGSVEKLHTVAGYTLGRGQGLKTA
ncbi:MAG: hypothetical protein V8Q85_04960 [Christensenellales bacterium]